LVQVEKREALVVVMVVVVEHFQGLQLKQVCGATSRDKAPLLPVVPGPAPATGECGPVEAVCLLLVTLVVIVLLVLAEVGVPRRSQARW
jgi:hypothetical protein